MLNRTICLILAAAIFVGMLVLVTWSSLAHNFFALPNSLTQSRWFITTCVDAYLALLFFYIWVFYKEPQLSNRLFWFFMVMGLGNIGTGAYLIKALCEMPPQFKLAQLIERTQ